jgi:hypothetical protein
MSTSLPTTRNLLTSLLNTLTAPTIQQPSNTMNEPYSTPSNPLKTLPAAQRALLTTLHVLFPPPMLLQALDLLDRGLVLRLIERTPLSASERNPSGQEEMEDVGQPVFPPQANIHLEAGAGESSTERPEKEIRKGERNTVYQVRSSQPPKSRFRDSGATATGSNVYTVRLGAWNCSCAAFAYSAFPGGESSGRPWVLDREWEGEGVGRLREEVGRGEDGEWEFGGSSFNGREGEGVPVCKHLVACLLGERWDLLGGYVREREVSSEEMGGAGGEG